MPRIEFQPWEPEHWGGLGPGNPVRHAETGRVGILLQIGLLLTYGEKTLTHNVVGMVEWLDDANKSFVPGNHIVLISAVDVLGEIV